MKPNELRALDALRISCPALDPALSNTDGDYQLTGSGPDSTPRIRVQATTLARAQRLYRDAYAKLEKNNLLPAKGPKR